jgi:hypothetical protein
MLKTIAVEEGDQQPRYPRKRLIDLAPPMAMKLRLMFMGSHSFLKQNSITFDEHSSLGATRAFGVIPISKCHRRK